MSWPIVSGIRKKRTEQRKEKKAQCEGNRKGDRKVREEYGIKKKKQKTREYY